MLNDELTTHMVVKIEILLKIGKDRKSKDRNTGRKILQILLSLKIH